jgi:hypothetical protein
MSPEEAFKYDEETFERVSKLRI